MTRSAASVEASYLPLEASGKKGVIAFNLLVFRVVFLHGLLPPLEVIITVRIAHNIYSFLPIITSSYTSSSARQFSIIFCGKGSRVVA